ncbi:MAG: Gfo/Idh/MocA family oxidoreductase [Chitinophagales bacterium]|nr:Gfo/Idh/MocA family oxidoreductase [Chitinophagales bacterium]MDW8393502.1 Gfo/Idh/MocA family oxidoreductase [Chitinophagales bacterium]
MNKRPGFAVIGMGYMGRRHAQIISAMDETQLVAVADTDPSLQPELTKTFGVPFYASAGELLEAHPEAEVICIATPNGSHAALALQALDAGRHVVIEKPMALTKADCEQVIHRSLQVGRHVFCVMQNRYSPPARWLKQLMDENRLGRIFLVQINCFWNRDDRYYRPGRRSPKDWKGTRLQDGGPLFTQFSHFVDMMFWLFGDIEHIRGRFENFAHRHSTEFADDTGLVTFRFRRGGMGCFSYSTAVWDRNLESSITIIGEKGSLRVGGQYMERVEYCHIRDYVMPELPPANPPNDYGDYKGSAANHQYVFRNVVETLRGQSTMTTNALEGMKVVEIIERIYRQLSVGVAVSAATE